MAGVRVTHPVARNCRFTIVEQDKPYADPYQCTAPEFGGCGVVHLWKTHHLNIDDTGSAIVERVLYQRIRHKLIENGFSEANEVVKPPALGIGLDPHGIGAWGNIPIVRGRGDQDG